MAAASAGEVSWSCPARWSSPWITRWGGVGFKRHSLFGRLARAGLAGEGDVADENRRAFQGQGKQFGAGKHREGQNIGRLVLAAPIAVEGLHLGIAGEQQAGAEARIGEFGSDVGAGGGGAGGEVFPVGGGGPGGVDVGFECGHRPRP